MIETARVRAYKDLAADISERICRELEILTRCCPNCEHWRDNPSGCRKADGTVPPPRVIAFGCELFEETIPF